MWFADLCQPTEYESITGLLKDLSILDVMPMLAIRVQWTFHVKFDFQVWMAHRCSRCCC